MQFGAKGDGSTDDTSAIESALAAAEAAQVPLYFPPGHYMVSSELVINTPGTVVEGAGRTQVTIESTAYPDSVFQIMSADNVTLSGINFLNSQPKTVVAMDPAHRFLGEPERERNAGVVVNNSDNVDIHDISSENFIQTVVLLGRRRIQNNYNNYSATNASQVAFNPQDQQPSGYYDGWHPRHRQ
jgi:polygalacturonase